MLQSENDAIQEKLLDRVANLDAARLRWIVAVIFTSLLFFIILGVFIAPVSELSTQQTAQFKISKNTNTEPLGIDTIAIPTTYFMHFRFELTPNYLDQHASAYIYVFKNDVPDMSPDTVGGELHAYLKGVSFRNATINAAHPVIKWDLAFRDCDTNRYYVIIYNPDDPNDPYDNKDVIMDMEFNYEPLLPLIPVFFVLAFIVILPLAIIRLYVVAQKKKELRVLLTLDLENLSNEDKLRLGIPITHDRAPPQAEPIRSQPPVFQQPGQLN
ncbi:MAG: hypothetical protein JXA22_06800 [Candidatus Thermoplasmatota archaeon]|nr:hypothetical protein [Candidatus Thermoplasmatota archaeon]